MKCIARFALFLFAAALTVAAQQPAVQFQSPSPTVQEIQKEYNALAMQQQLLYEKLHGITEFQQYLKVQEDIQTLNQKYQRQLSAEAEAAKKAATTTPAPTTPKPSTPAPNTPAKK